MVITLVYVLCPVRLKGKSCFCATRKFAEVDQKLDYLLTMHYGAGRLINRQARLLSREGLD